MLAIPQPNVGCTHSFHQALYSKLTFLLGQGVANAFAQQMETGIPGQAPFLYPDTAPQVDIDEERNNAQLESGEALGVFNFNKDHNTHLILVVRKIAGATIEPLPAETQGFDKEPGTGVRVSKVTLQGQQTNPLRRERKAKPLNDRNY